MPKTFQDKVDAIDLQAEQLSSGFRNLEPEALIPFRDLMVYLLHMENRAMLLAKDASAMLRLQVRSEVYAEIASLVDNAISIKREPEEGINGPEETDD